MAVIYGRRAATLILRHQKDRVRKIYYNPSAKFDAELLRLVSDFGGDSLTTDELDELTSSAVHQGIVLEVTAQKEITLKELIVKSLSAEGKGIILALDQITDPHNLGAIIRAADAFGVDGILSTDKRSAALTDVAVKSSAGASEFIPFCVQKNLARSIEELKKAGFWIVGTAFSDDSQDLREFEIEPPFVLVMGSEGKGMRDLTKKSCDYLIEIPMQGVVESLNVSQATSVALWELGKKNEQS